METKQFKNLLLLKRHFNLSADFNHLKTVLQKYSSDNWEIDHISGDTLYVNYFYHGDFTMRGQLKVVKVKFSKENLGKTAISISLHKYFLIICLIFSFSVPSILFYNEQTDLRTSLMVLCSILPLLYIVLQLNMYVQSTEFERELVAVIKKSK